MARLLLLLIALTLLACREQSEPETAASSAPATPTGIQVFSKAFAPGQTLPIQYTCLDRNFSPPLRWSGLPADTRGVVMTLEDADAGHFLHWAIYNLPPPITQLPEDLPPHEMLALGALHARNDFGKIGYGGPCPPAGQTHRYLFRVHALDAMLQIEPGASRAQLEKAMNGHLLARGDLEVSFKR